MSMESLRSLRFIVSLLFVSIAIQSLSSCYRAAKIYEEFVEQAPGVDTVILIHDVLILDDIQGKRHYIHIEENFQALEWINDVVKEIVESKGYDVSDRSVWSIGLTEKPGTPYLVFTESTGEKPGFFANTGLSNRQTPIEVRTAGFAEYDISTIAALLRHLNLEGQSIEEMEGTFYSSYTRKLDLPRQSVLLVTQTFGEQIPTGKKISVLMRDLLLGTVLNLSPPPMEHDITKHFLFILDSQTGELLWADLFEELGGNRNKNELYQGLSRLFSELPDREP
ncbi:hypothetical protein ACFL1C_06335 [Pseudomonadota bacterium]